MNDGWSKYLSLDMRLFQIRIQDDYDDVGISITLYLVLVACGPLCIEDIGRQTVKVDFRQLCT